MYCDVSSSLMAARHLSISSFPTALTSAAMASFLAIHVPNPTMYEPVAPVLEWSAVNILSLTGGLSIGLCLRGQLMAAITQTSRTGIWHLFTFLRYLDA